MFRRILTLLAKDLRIELRTREVMYTSVLFAVVLVVVFMFSGFETPGVRAQAAPGILWVSIAFVGTLVFGRTFQRERDEGAIAGLLLVPRIVDALFFAKLAVNLLMLVAIEVVLVPLVFAVFRIDATAYGPQVAGIVLVGTLGFAVLGTVLSAALATVRLREVILPLVLYPLCIPIFVAGTRATDALIQDSGDVWGWVQIIIAFDVAFFVLGRWLFGTAIDP